MSTLRALLIGTSRLSHLSAAIRVGRTFGACPRRCHLAFAALQGHERPHPTILEPGRG